MHVEVQSEALPDAGSIPAASMSHSMASPTEVTLGLSVGSGPVPAVHLVQPASYGRDPADRVSILLRGGRITAVLPRRSPPDSAALGLCR